ncbi:hypothetical protein ACJX0J_034770, partial [Zea mays]
LFFSTYVMFAFGTLLRGTITKFLVCAATRFKRGFYILPFLLRYWQRIFLWELRHSTCGYREQLLWQHIH